jgi:membrane protein YqaA with SNARE-associated domain
MLHKSPGTRDRMWEILGGLLVGTAVSGVLPLVNAEILIVAAAAAVPGAGVPLVVAVSTLGQMLTKTGLFALARWAPSRLPERAKKKLDRAATAVSERGGAAGSFVFMSAALGIPPFYGTSLACGALGMRLPTFVVTGTAGRAIRFGAFAWAGHRFGGSAIELISISGVPSALMGG